MANSVFRGEQKSMPPHRVLRISESALFVDGAYIGEIGNSRYKDKEDMFTFDPEHGLLISGTKGEATLSKEDVASIPHALGHISIEHLLGSETVQLSGEGFERKLYAVARDVENRVNKIRLIAQTLGLEWQPDTLDHYINRVAQTNPIFTPEELLEKVLEGLKEDMRFEKNEDKAAQAISAIDGLKRIGILSLGEKRRRETIVEYFYLYCRLKGIDTSSPTALLEPNALEGFQFVDELIEEYKRKPDARFGDAVLDACSQLQKKWERETAGSQ
jgi:hypothetical protein